MPSGGIQSARQITSWEIRDILPALWHLWQQNGISIRVYFRTWETYDQTSLMCSWQYPTESASVNPIIYEKPVDITSCLPFADTYRPPPSDKDRSRAQSVLRQGLQGSLPLSTPATKHDAFFTIPGDIYNFHRVRFYDALGSLSQRIAPQTGKIHSMSIAHSNADNVADFMPYPHHSTASSIPQLPGSQNLSLIHI